MTRALAALLLLLTAVPACAHWEFSEAREVSGSVIDAFPHLDSAGRRSVAVGEGRVAVVWEDNRSGSPQVYGAFCEGEGAFTEPQRLSHGREAFEPAVAAVGNRRFLVVWEQEGVVWARIISAEGSGAPVRLSAGEAGQATAVAAAGIFAAWSEARGPHRGIVLGQVEVDGMDITNVKQLPLGPAPKGDQLYPALALANDSLVLAWEDRRAGRTRLYVSQSMKGWDLGGARPLNELSSGGNLRFGRGSGVTRVTLAAHGETVAAAWMDKRAFRGGYDIYAAVRTEAGGEFGGNELVQDMFGENTPQWHPSIAVGPRSGVVVAWDDPRDGTPDVWFSRRTGDGVWSDDIPVTPAYGPGAQASPSIAFDADGRLHMAWVEQVENQPSRVLYATARWVDE